MRSEFLHFAPPLIGDEEIEEVVRTLRSGWLTTGPKTKQFEAEFAAYLGFKLESRRFQAKRLHNFSRN